MAPASIEGQILGGTYRVENLLGKGGMGAVYAAAHLRLPTRVAIKLLHAEAAANAEIFARFRREAEISSGLRHPNIVQVFDFNHLADGTPYLIMEYLEGEDLAGRLRQRGRLSYLEVAALCQAIGSGLSAAHKREVVHRDLKPQNIFLARHEQGDGIVEIPKIVDFGISKIRHAVMDSLKTRDEQLLGTPNYMSPEQARGLNSEVDARTDQWALAAILYQCLTGRLAFSGDTLAGIIYQVVLAEPAPLRSLCPEVPAHAEEAILRALSKDRERRFPNILEFTRAFCGTDRALASAGSTPAMMGGDHPLLQTPGVSGVDVPLSTPPPLSGTGGRHSVTGAGGQIMTPPSGRRRLLLGLAGGTVGLLGGGALLLLGLRPVAEPVPKPLTEKRRDTPARPEPGDNAASPTPDLRAAADLRPADPRETIRPATDRAPEPPVQDGRGRGRGHGKEKERHPRPRAPQSDADDVDISGIK